MFEYFFAKKLSDRNRDQQLRTLNANLDSGMLDRRSAERGCDGFADSATSLPAGFVERRVAATE